MQRRARSAMEGFPDNIKDIVDAGRTGLQVARTQRSAPNDFRPNRMIKGSTRTSRVLQRTCAFNTTQHRDKVMQGRQMSALDQQKHEWTRRVAAERIQRTWRAWYKYCQENSEWLMTTWIAATMIQARWRAYHMKRVKLDKAATNIQRLARAFLVRKVLRQRRAAVVIQRRARGMIARKRVRGMHEAGVKLQSLVRGGLARRRVAIRRVAFHRLALTIQCAIRTHLACRRTQALRDAKADQKAREESAVHIQRLYRGTQGREVAQQKLDLYNRQLEQYRAATKLPGLPAVPIIPLAPGMRAALSSGVVLKQVDKVRADKFDKMNQVIAMGAATFIRKMWLGARYRELLEEFGRHVHNVVTIQRYGRGFLVRLRMWRQAVRAEEELWGALEIQRVWRGYLGRVKWETKYEQASRVGG
ncbi:unnamed protein product [Effrenium voratum]|nr:unnamed protein product [Effrenium voratum]